MLIYPFPYERLTKIKESKYFTYRQEEMKRLNILVIETKKKYKFLIDNQIY